jgi:glycosyltransferase involved in cell wall biosynthesis
MKPKTLVVISPLQGYPRSNGQIILTQKFVDGMKLYRELWDGPILHICAPADHESDSLDNIEVPMSMPEFDTVCDIISREALERAIPKNSVVLTSVGDSFNFVAPFCRVREIPCVYVSEYNLRTRHQILDEIQPNLLKRTFRKLRETRQEALQRDAIAASDAIQCNGLPTYEAYKDISKSPFLFFDSRIDDDMIASNSVLLKKAARRDQLGKLHLVFSGRLNLMKGVDDLPKVAGLLRDRGVDFEMSICGDGEYRDCLRDQIEQHGLSGRISLKGNMDFRTELVPFVTDQADLFICCHRQGDPSCTYLETMSCGVPIVGYDNDAFDLLAKHARVGFPVKMGDVKALADAIEGLHRNPELTDASWRSRDFAAEHTFHKTFKRRIGHLKLIAAQHREELRPAARAD